MKKLLALLALSTTASASDLYVNAQYQQNTGQREASVVGESLEFDIDGSGQKYQAGYKNVFVYHEKNKVGDEAQFSDGRSERSFGVGFRANGEAVGRFTPYIEASIGKATAHFSERDVRAFRLLNDSINGLVFSGTLGAKFNIVENVSFIAGGSYTGTSWESFRIYGETAETTDRHLGLFAGVELAL